MLFYLSSVKMFSIVCFNCWIHKLLQFKEVQHSIIPFIRPSKCYLEASIQSPVSQVVLICCPETYTHRILQMYYVWSLLLFIRHGIQIHQRSVLYYERRIFWELVLGDSFKNSCSFLRCQMSTFVLSWSWLTCIFVLK